MNDKIEPNCRIKRVRMKAGGADVTILHTPKHKPENDMFFNSIEWVLEHARSNEGRVIGFAAVVVLDDNDDSFHTIEMGSPIDRRYRTAVLGSMQVMVSNYHRRWYDEADDARIFPEDWPT